MELTYAIRLASRAVLGPGRRWSSGTSLSHSRARLLRRQLLRHGEESWHTAGGVATLRLCPSGVWASCPARPDFAPSDLVGWVLRLTVLAQVMRDPPAELLAVSSLLLAKGRVTVGRS